MNARLAAVAGVIFAVLTFLSVAAADPLRQATDTELLDWWASDSNRQSLYVSMYFRLLSVPFLLAFLVQLRARLRVTEGPDGWSDLISSLGLLAAAGLAISGIGRGILAQTVDLRDEPLPGVDTLRLVTEDSLGIYSLVAVPALALVVGVTALIILRTKVMPAWTAWLGLPIAALSLVMVALQMGAFATPLLLIWTVATSVALFRSGQSITPELSFVEARSATG